MASNEELAGEMIQADANLRYEIMRFRGYMTEVHPESESHFEALIVAFQAYLSTLNESIETLVQ